MKKLLTILAVAGFVVGAYAADPDRVWRESVRETIDLGTVTNIDLTAAKALTNISVDVVVTLDVTKAELDGTNYVTDVTVDSVDVTVAAQDADFLTGATLQKN